VGKVFDSLDDKLRAFIEAQHMFFVATAPLGPEGHVNLSPKGLDSFRVLGPKRVAYLDLTGSGAETVAHLRENGRITLLFCAFADKPRILRLYGHGMPHVVGTPGFDALAAEFPELPGRRSIIEVELSRIADSCGWGVPRMSFESDRSQLPDFATTLGPERVTEYQRTGNSKSIDGLPAIDLD